MQHFSLLCADSETKVCTGGGELIKAALHLGFRLGIAGHNLQETKSEIVVFLVS